MLIFHSNKKIFHLFLDLPGFLYHLIHTTAIIADIIDHESLEFNAPLDLNAPLDHVIDRNKKV